MDKLQMKFLHYQVASLPDGVAGKGIDEAWVRQRSLVWSATSGHAGDIGAASQQCWQWESILSCEEETHWIQVNNISKIVESTLVLKTDIQAKSVSCFQQSFTQDLKWCDVLVSVRYHAITWISGGQVSVDLSVLFCF